MTKRFATRALFALLATTGAAHGMGYIPHGDKHCDGWCVEAAWDWYTWCWFASGMPQKMKIQPADAIGNPIDPGGIKWNVPFDNNWTPTLGLKFAPDLLTTPAQNTPANSTASVPAEYDQICTQYGAGFYFIPGTETCVRFGSNNTYEQKQPVFEGKLRIARDFGYQSTPHDPSPAGGSSASGGGGSGGMPVEYVKICDVYGQGFFYIPGADNCIKLGSNPKYDLKPLPSGLRVTTTYDSLKTQQTQQPGGDAKGAQKPAGQPATIRTQADIQRELDAALQEQKKLRDQ